MIFNVTKANAKVKEVNEVNAKLTTELAEKNTLLEAANVLTSVQANKIAVLEKQIADMTTTHQTEMTNVVNGHEEAMNNLTKAVQEANQSAGKVASDIVASIGIEPELVKVSANEITGTSGFKPSKSSFKFLWAKKPAEEISR